MEVSRKMKSKKPFFALCTFVSSGTMTLISLAGLWWSQDPEYIMHSAPYAYPYHIERPNEAFTPWFLGAAVVSALVCYLAYQVLDQWNERMNMQDKQRGLRQELAREKAHANKHRQDKLIAFMTR